MAQFLTTNGISNEIETIIREAKNNIFLVSPYLNLSKTLHERLLDAANRHVPITIVYGKVELSPEVVKKLSTLKNLQLYYFENLHAKCYFNEHKMVITSMNIHAFSEKNNREMGILINKIEDKSLYEDGANEVISIIQSSINEKPNKGYCIRCNIEIEYNVEKPYCPNCYASWAQYRNMAYHENVCHKCGKSEQTSMIKPECYQCYQESTQY